MRKIEFEDLKYYINKEIYQYAACRWKKFEIVSCSHTTDIRTLNYDLEEINSSGIRISHVISKAYCELYNVDFYATLKEAKLKQVLDVYNVTIGRSNLTIAQHYEQFIDKEIDFFLTHITDSQLREKEYFDILKLISKNNPEYLI